MEARAWWDARAADYDATDDAARMWRHTATNVVCQRSEVRATDRVVDLGCGTGNVARTLAPHVERVIAVDCSPNMLRRAQEGPDLDITWVEGDLRTVAIPRGTHVVTACFALNELSDRDRLALFERVHDKLVDGGLLVIADWYWNVPFEDTEGIEGWFAPDRVVSVSGMQVMRELEERGYRAVHEPLHPAVSVLTAMRM
ncbi:MAG: class I SAM-dependent methyltransferase [Proteobacteria bacterium]|nr:class I SAM-dependent methyltransferase [Pseudomonadota bacterium]MCP4921232.1 class I SAM-dependent methyltransferase [Pseudomonadota bacterium]